MKQFLKWTGFVLFAAIIGLALSVAFVARARAQSPGAVVQQAVTPATSQPTPSGPWGYGYWGNYGSARVYSPTQLPPYYGPGMMSRRWSGYGGWGMGPGMMGAYGHMGGMMAGYDGWGYGYGAPQGTPVPVDEEIQLSATNFRFDPATVTVKAGEAVRLNIVNQDGVPHNLYGLDVPIAYALLPAGVSRAVTFTAPTTAGRYQAVCTFHPGMTLDIIVK